MLAGIVILTRLFSLQIVNGAEYRGTSNTKLSRETIIDATRGSILDRNGTSLVSSEMVFSLEMYKSKADDKSLNSSISLMSEILRNNGDSYVDNFPISINPFAFNFDSEESLAKWKENYKIPEAASAEEAFYLFRDKYNIDSEDIDEIRRILAIRYEISTKGYSATRSLAISKSITRNSAIQLQENSNDLTGVNVITDSNRIYSMGNLGSHIIGYMGRISEKDEKRMQESGDTYEYESNDKIGQAGIERVFEKYLRGENGEKQIDMDVNGTITGEYTTKEAIGGSDIVLTIDANLQRITEEALANCINGIRTGAYSQVYNAKGGACVAMDVNTGEILAMASNPDYTPEVLYNGISTEQLTDYNNKGVWTNKAIQGTYSPGSTFKMVTAAAGLETGAITATETIYDSGVYMVNGLDRERHCWIYDSTGGRYGHGRVNVVGALEKSCNVFFYETGRRTGLDTIAKYANHFGLGKKTGVELYGEAKGSVSSSETEKSSSVGFAASAAIGQGKNHFTPVQMAKYISMVANGGNNLDVTIVKDVMNSDGTNESREEIEDFVNSELGLTETSSTNDDITIKPENFATIKEGMRRVTEGEGGTASSVFNDFGVTVGGKTGSVETGTTAGADIHAWFVGFAPFDNPQIAVVVVVENGGHGFYTADVVKAVMQEYFGTNRTGIDENMSINTEDEYFN